MSGIFVYLAVALLCAAAVFLFAEWSREPGIAAPDNPGVLALVAGLLWPILVIGIAQLAGIAAARARIRARTGPGTPARVGSPV
ncbi:MAG: hypothetical protein ACKOQ4_07635 [Mycobacterium sp.]